ncbi:Cytosolic sulfotransferase 4 [Armadillidium vulgare]|nr:Cytosolic sulfotransferase 4 [Armadillidium vulgare]
MHNIMRDHVINCSSVNIAAPGTFLHDKLLQDHPNCNPKDGIFLQLTEFAEDPRIIKTHLPFSLQSPFLLESCKVIYVARDPRDVVVMMHSPFWTHLKEAWNKRSHPNIHYCFYEDMKANPKEEIIRIQKFLNVDLTESQINEIVHYTSFQEMSKREEKMVIGSDIVEINPKIVNKDGGFFRKGVTGDYKTKLSEEDIQKINEWTKENTRDMEDEFKYKIK